VRRGRPQCRPPTFPELPPELREREAARLRERPFDRAVEGVLTEQGRSLADVAAGEYVDLYRRRRQSSTRRRRHDGRRQQSPPATLVDERVAALEATYFDLVSKSIARRTVGQTLTSVPLGSRSMKRRTPPSPHYGGERRSPSPAQQPWRGRHRRRPPRPRCPARTCRRCRLWSPGPRDWPVRRRSQPSRGPLPPRSRAGSRRTHVSRPDPRGLERASEALMRWAGLTDRLRRPRFEAFGSGNDTISGFDVAGRVEVVHTAEESSCVGCCS
jgi:hypothetical protein